MITRYKHGQKWSLVDDPAEQMTLGPGNPRQMWSAERVLKHGYRWMHRGLAHLQYDLLPRNIVTTKNFQPNTNFLTFSIKFIF